MRRVQIVLLGLLAIVLPLLALAPAQAAAGGIVGKVTADDTGAGLPGVKVTIKKCTRDFIDRWVCGDPFTVVTDENGDFLTLVDEGFYTLRFDDPNVHLGEWYSDKYREQEASVVGVGAGAMTTVNAGLRAGSGIRGKITTLGQPLAGATVGVYSADGVYTRGETETAADGTYAVSLVPGSFVVCFYPPINSSLTLFDECYQDADDHDPRTLVTFEPLRATTLDAELGQPGTLSGTVTDAFGPLAGATASIRPYGRPWSANDPKVTTDARGRYRFEGLRPRDYLVQFHVEGDLFAIPEYYDDIFATNEATRVRVPSAGAATGIDARLERQGRVSDATIPDMSEVGDTLAVTGIVVAPEDLSLSYQWLRSGVVIPGATGRTYVTTDADTTGWLSVRVTATKPGWLPATVQSNRAFVQEADVPPTPFAQTLAVEFAKVAVTGVPKVTKKVYVINLISKHRGIKVVSSFQWLLGRKPAPLGQKKGFYIRRTAKGKKLSVRVTWTAGSTTLTRRIMVGRIK